MSTGGFLTLVGLSETLKQHYLSKKFERAERTPLRGFPVCRYVVPFFERLSVAAGQLLSIFGEFADKTRLDPVPRVNLCPGGFCCCVKLDSSYQVAKIAEIF